MVKAAIPQDAGLPDTEVSVLLGNLLENALDACRQEESADKRIIVRAGVEGGALCITVDNTYTGSLKLAEDGQLLSTKHNGPGLGTRSVQSIAQQHGGLCRLEVREGMFCASVYCSRNL